MQPVGNARVQRSSHRRGETMGCQGSVRCWSVLMGTYSRTQQGAFFALERGEMEEIRVITQNDRPRM